MCYNKTSRATLPVQDSDTTTATHTTCDVHTIGSSGPVGDGILNSSPRRHSSVDEIYGLVNSMSLNNGGQRQRSLSDSGRSERSNNSSNVNGIVLIGGVWVSLLISALI